MRCKLLLIIIHSILIISFVVHADEKIKFGITAPLTGDYALAGEDISRGANLAVQDLKDENIHIELFIENAWLPAEGVSAIKKLIAYDKIDALASNYSLILLNAVLPIINKHKLVFMHNSIVPSELIGSSPYVFTTWTSIEEEVRNISKILSDKEIEIPAIVYLESTWGIAYSKAFESEMIKKGVKLGYSRSQSFGTHDFRSEISRLKATKPTMLFVVHSGANLVSFLKQLRNFKFSNLRIFLPSDADDIDLLKASGDSAEGIDLFSIEPRIPTSGQRKFTKQYLKLYNREATPLSKHAYDQVSILGRAITKCNRDKSCVANYIQEIKEYDGASGLLSINKNRLAVRPMHLKRVKNGMFHFIE